MTQLDAASVVLSRAAEIAGGERAQVAVWYRTGLPEFGGRSPEELVAAGKVELVLEYLDSIQSGYVG